MERLLVPKQISLPRLGSNKILQAIILSTAALASACVSPRREEATPLSMKPSARAPAHWDAFPIGEQMSDLVPECGPQASTVRAPHIIAPSAPIVSEVVARRVQPFLVVDASAKISENSLQTGPQIQPQAPVSPEPVEPPEESEKKSSDTSPTASNDLPNTPVLKSVSTRHEVHPPTDEALYWFLGMMAVLAAAAAACVGKDLHNTWNNPHVRSFPFRSRRRKDDGKGPMMFEVMKDTD